MKNALREERESFLEDIAAINLRRIWWLTLATIVLTASILLYNLLIIRRLDLLAVETVDFLISLATIVLVGLARAGKLGRWWRRNLATLFLLFMLATMDAYFFTSLPLFGHTSSYALGAVISGVVLLLPPLLFLSLLLANHAVYCTLLLLSGRTGDAIAAGIADGTAAVLVAGMASWFLYTAHRDNFRKERIIAQRNRQLAASNAGLKQLNEEMNELMAIAAHDLRSPLQGQKNLLELAVQRVSLGGEHVARILDAAVDGCKGMLHLVARLLEAHAAEHGLENLALRRMDLEESFAAAAERVRAAAKAKNLRVDLELPGEPATASSEPAALAQVLDNLLVNAIKFSPPGTTIQLALLRAGSLCHGEVRDEGPGIPAEEQAGLFRKFHRGSARPTGNEPSTGLGLFIVRKIMLAMGGDVVYLPREPRGSIFRLSFPDAAFPEKIPARP